MCHIHDTNVWCTFCLWFICYIDVILFNVFLYGASMQINDLIMIEVVLLCHLLAPALNIPHLGCDRPSDPANWTQPNVWSDPSVPGAHSDNNCVLCIIFWGAHWGTMLHFWCPIRGLYISKSFILLWVPIRDLNHCVLHYIILNCITLHYSPMWGKSSCVSLCGVTPVHLGHRVTSYLVLHIYMIESTKYIQMNLFFLILLHTHYTQLKQLLSFDYLFDFRWTWMNQ